MNFCYLKEDKYGKKLMDTATKTWMMQKPLLKKFFK